jgi:hypothetical protein
MGFSSRRIFYKIFLLALLGFQKQNILNPHLTIPFIKGEGLKLGSISHNHTVFRLTPNLLSFVKGEGLGLGSVGW